MSTGDLLFNYCTEHSIGKHSFHEETGELRLRFKEEEFHRFRETGFVFDAQKGGIVLGKLHSEGGIQLIRKNADGLFEHIGEMEGWEYLSAPIQWMKARWYFEVLNREKLKNKTEDTSFEFPSECAVIDTREAAVPILLLDETFHQYIINRFATRKFIDRILEVDLISRYANMHLDKITAEFNF